MSVRNKHYTSFVFLVHISFSMNKSYLTCLYIVVNLLTFPGVVKNRKLKYCVVFLVDLHLSLLFFIFSFSLKFLLWFLCSEVRINFFRSLKDQIKIHLIRSLRFVMFLIKCIKFSSVCILLFLVFKSMLCYYIYL